MFGAPGLVVGAVVGDGADQQGHPVNDFAVPYHEKVLHQEHLLKSLTPLYLGQMASLVLRTQQQKPEDVEDCIEELCDTFARMKPYLVERWRFS